MKFYFTYLKYVVRHKYFVFLAGLKTNTPIWQLVVHDLSKFLPSEFGPYARFFYGPYSSHFHQSNPLNIPEGCSSCDEEAVKVKHAKDEFTMAWFAHQRRNRHHWEHWVMTKGPDEQKALPIPDKYLRELVADWCGAARTITGRWEINTWYENNRNKILLHPASRARIEAMLSRFNHLTTNDT